MRLSPIANAILIISLFVILFIVPVNSAVIEGNVYSWELKKIKAVVEINTTPIQRIVAENGTYEFNVSFGTYKITAYSDGLSCEEKIVIEREGIYRLDLILFPNLNYGINWTEPNFSFETEKAENFPITIPILIAILLFLSLSALYFLRRKKRKRPIERNSRETELTEDLIQLLDILRSLGGRATQKELREKLGWSEAKLSLALTDLERRNIIEKYKKGRGNIIFLKGK